MSPRGRPRAFDREKVLAEAMHVFWERGYEGASLAELTAAMGINPPSLYAAFGGKESLFREALELYGVTDGQYTARALREQPTARASVEAMLRDNARAYCEPGHPTGCMVVLAATNYTGASQGVHDYVAELRAATKDKLRKRLRQGVEEGELAEDADVGALATFYTTVLHGLSLQARDGADRAELDRAIDLAMASWPRP
ncbi:TetR/AcrR family transcriptional regulator [Amycolatopsis sp. H20-H5]|uniref:TetR/AcrR family transcriptional regulator n=1 Tax=Amycolatopsis sp. H20-H5 TaxID=3046309 RepID=UPI002DBB32AE|nr:TetR/AcrR family transcriptional regulator [Amycolatopsis sp. H20-H5]MEC3982128.1 TetR/AcrR family transcriptional regulator [Amycolatopsis sp. H20-H5]